jgi:HEAT repeat protein
VTALADDDYNVQANAIQALGILGDKRAIEPLQRALERWREAPNEKKSPAIYRLIAEALKKLGVTAPNP